MHDRKSYFNCQNGVLGLLEVRKFLTAVLDIFIFFLMLSHESHSSYIFIWCIFRELELIVFVISKQRLCNLS